MVKLVERRAECGVARIASNFFFNFALTPVQPHIRQTHFPHTFYTPERRFFPSYSEKERESFMRPVGGWDAGCFALPSYICTIRKNREKLFFFPSSPMDFSQLISSYLASLSLLTHSLSYTPHISTINRSRAWQPKLDVCCWNADK